MSRDGYGSCFRERMIKQPKSPRPAGSAKEEMAKTPGKDDLHEQREPDQKQEAVLKNTTPDPSPPQV